MVCEEKDIFIVENCFERIKKLMKVNFRHKNKKNSPYEIYL